MNSAIDMYFTDEWDERFAYQLDVQPGLIFDFAANGPFFWTTNIEENEKRVTIVKKNTY